MGNSSLARLAGVRESLDFDGGDVTIFQRRSGRYGIKRRRLLRAGAAVEFLALIAFCRSRQIDVAPSAHEMTEPDRQRAGRRAMGRLVRQAS